MNKSLTALVLTFILFSQALQASNLADCFKRFEKTVNIAINRINFILSADNTEAPNMNTLIIRHVELAAIANECICQNEEDFYNLAIYLVASHFGQTKLALEVLKHELEVTNYSPLERWLRLRVAELESDKVTMTDIAIELRTLTKALNINK